MVPRQRRHVSHRLENLNLLHRSVQVQVFIFDYREYGKSEGRISREGTYKDCARGLPLRDRHQGPGPRRDLVLFGRSLGTALAVDMAARLPCRSLIIESAFTNSSELAKLFLPFMFDWRPRVPYDNLGKIDKIKAPLLIIHGSEARSSPFP